jgi:hypothetical protein
MARTVMNDHITKFNIRLNLGMFPIVFSLFGILTLIARAKADSQGATESFKAKYDCSFTCCRSRFYVEVQILGSHQGVNF